VAYSLDVILAQCSAKTSMKLKTFEYLVAMICHFVRFSLTPAMKADRANWDNITIKAPATLIGYDHSLPLDQEKYPISDQHIDYLIESDLISMALKEGVQTE
jgi:hypothetical protein